MNVLTELHVVPDWQPHDLAPDCACRPTMADIDHGLVYVHRLAADDPPRYSPDSDPALKVPGRGWLVIDSAAVEAN
jgi:hypothetical protein